MRGQRTAWLGRAIAEGEATVRWVRGWTGGEAPTADDVVEDLGPAWPDDPAAAGDGSRGGQLRVADLRLLPCTLPSKILGVGRNYARHAAEMGQTTPAEPLLFFKPPSAVVTGDEPVVLPAGYERIDMEAELVVVIGRRCRNLSEHEALDVVLGYTLGNDVSCRDLQQSDGQWTRAKGFDTFAPIGAWMRLATPRDPLPGHARIRGYYDDALVQDAPVSDMVFSIARILVHASACMTLEPGDAIFTGTPEGVTPLRPGGQTRVELAGWSLGVLRNLVVRG